MLDLNKKTDVLQLLMAAGYNCVMAERFVQPTRVDCTCTIWKERDFDFMTTVTGHTVEDVKAGHVPGFEFVQYEPGEVYILEVSY